MIDRKLKNVLEGTTYENLIRDIFNKVNLKKMSKAKRKIKRTEIELTYLTYTYNIKLDWLNSNRNHFTNGAIMIFESELEVLKTLIDERKNILKN